MKQQIYLDYNASAPLRSEARDAMLNILGATDHALNASSIHSYGRQARTIVESARENVASLVGVPTNQLIFNSGATEGNNTVIAHFANAFPNDAILISAIEHPSILELTSVHSNIHVIPVHKNGLIDAAALESLLKEHKTSLVSCIYANNETGIIQDINAISQIAHRHGALLHSDATQAAGRIAINMQSEGIDFLTLSSHKIGGPQGVGALALGLCGQTPVLLHGGGQEKSARAGTENVAGIAGFSAAAVAAKNSLHDYSALSILRDRLENNLKSLSPDITIHGQNVERLPNTCFFSHPQINSQTALIAFDLGGIAISNGSACSSGTVKPSVVLKAMGYDDNVASGALRISLGWATQESDIDAALKAWEKIYARIKK